MSRSIKVRGAAAHSRRQLPLRSPAPPPPRSNRPTPHLGATSPSQPRTPEHPWPLFPLPAARQQVQQGARPASEAARGHAEAGSFLLGQGHHLVPRVSGPQHRCGPSFGQAPGDDYSSGLRSTGRAARIACVALAEGGSDARARLPADELFAVIMKASSDGAAARAPSSPLARRRRRPPRCRAHLRARPLPVKSDRSHQSATVACSLRR